MKRKLRGADMKKYSYVLFCVALLMLVLTACKGSKKETDYETVNNFEGVTMTVKEETVSSTGLTVIFENNSDKQGVYGDFFMLEKESNGQWYEVPVRIAGNYGFDDIGYDLFPSDIQEWPVDWEWLYGTLDSGTYRIVKDMLDFRKAGDFDTYYLAAQFTIAE